MKSSLEFFSEFETFEQWSLFSTILSIIYCDRCDPKLKTEQEKHFTKVEAAFNQNVSRKWN